MELREFIKKKGLTLAQFGATLTPPVDHATISRWCSGTQMPSLEWLAKLELATNNRVRARDFLLSKETRDL